MEFDDKIKVGDVVIFKSEEKDLKNDILNVFSNRATDNSTVLQKIIWKCVLADIEINRWDWDDSYPQRGTSCMITSPSV